MNKRIYSEKIRNRALVEEKIYTKSRRNKKKKTPKYKIDDIFVATHNDMFKKRYHLVRVLDLNDEISDFSYFCELLKTTDKHKLHKIGRIVNVVESGWSLTMIDAKVKDENIEWIKI